MVNGYDKRVSPEVIDGVRLIISFFTSPQSPRSGPEGSGV